MSNSTVGENVAARRRILNSNFKYFFPNYNQSGVILNIRYKMVGKVTLYFLIGAVMATVMDGQTLGGK